MRRAVLALALASTACDDFAELEALKPHSLTVNLVDRHFLSDGGALDVPLPANSGEVVATVKVREQWKTFAAEWKSDGLAELQVPAGETFIDRPGGRNRVHVAGSPAQLDLGEDVLGPPIARGPAGTSVTFDVTGADPADAGSLLTIRVPEYETSSESVTAVWRMSTVPLVVQDGLTAFSYVESWVGDPMLRSGPVELYQSQLEQVTSSEREWTVTRRGSATVTPVGGRNVKVPVALGPLPPLSATVPAITYDFGPLAAQVEPLLPTKTFSGASMSVLAQPNGNGSESRVQTLFSTVQGGPKTLSAMVSDPLGGAPWVAQHQLALWYESTILLENMATTQARPFVLGAQVSGPAGETGWVSMAPLLPVAEITATVVVDGMATQAATGLLASRTPRVEWQAPTVGVATHYLLSIVQVDISTEGVVTLVQDPTTIVTGSTGFELPNDMLAAHTNYVFLVGAESCARGPQEAPFRRTSQPTCARSLTRSELFFTP